MILSRYVSQVPPDTTQLYYYAHLSRESKHLIYFYFDLDVYALLIKGLFQYGVYQTLSLNNVFIGGSDPENLLHVLRTQKNPGNLIDASTLKFSLDIPGLA